MLDETSQRYVTAILDGDTGTADRLAALLDTADTLDRQRREHPPVMLDAALDYAAAGFYCFPVHHVIDGHCSCRQGAECERGAKHPLSPNGLNDGTTDAATIREWWRRWPDANIGARTGITFDVIDVDGIDGIATMYTGDNPIVDDFTIIGTSRTGRDGGRHLYIPPTGRRNNTALLPGVDFRGEGGYVILPPSLSITGRRYEWVIELNTGQAAA